MENKVVGLVKEIGQFLVGEVLSENEVEVVLQNVAMLGISSNANQVNIQFIPIDLLSMNPPIGVKNLISNPNNLPPVTFQKKDLLFYGMDLADNVVTNFKTFLLSSTKNASVEATQTQVPDENIVKLFD